MTDEETPVVVTYDGDGNLYITQGHATIKLTEDGGDELISRITQTISKIDAAREQELKKLEH